MDRPYNGCVKYRPKKTITSCVKKIVEKESPMIKKLKGSFESIVS